MTSRYSLPQLGWQVFFQQQLTLDEWELFMVGRVSRQERSQLHVLTADGSRTVPLAPGGPALTVGDWILLNGDGQFHRLLDRLTVFSRKAAGTSANTQLIAANVDTVFIVCSLNQDFNLNRIERYLVLANQSGAEPVVALSKADTCPDPESYLGQVQALDTLLQVLTVNCLDPDSAHQLDPWCQPGKTVALLGSSGVGKSTLINTLSGKSIQLTHSSRSSDDKGRHTTTGRSIHLLNAGGLLLDTPGMREIQLADCEQGVEGTFAEIIELSLDCKFSDCRHQDEPGCAVQAAILAGTLTERRLSSYHKLMREQAFNEATLAERRDRDRKLGKFYRSVQAISRQQKKV